MERLLTPGEISLCPCLEHYGSVCLWDGGPRTALKTGDTNDLKISLCLTAQVSTTPYSLAELVHNSSHQASVPNIFLTWLAVVPHCVNIVCTFLRCHAITISMDRLYCFIQEASKRCSQKTKCPKNLTSSCSAYRTSTITSSDSTGRPESLTKARSAAPVLPTYASHRLWSTTLPNTQFIQMMKIHV